MNLHVYRSTSQVNYSLLFSVRLSEFLSTGTIKFLCRLSDTVHLRTQDRSTTDMSTIRHGKHLLRIYIQGVSGGIVNILGGRSIY